MSFYEVPGDKALERAQQKLATAQAHLQRAEAAPYCCEYLQDFVVKKAKREVKRWETWLNDRGVLEAEQTALPGL